MEPDVTEDRTMARLIAAFLCFATLAISPAIAGERPASVTPAEAAASIASNTPPQVLDVRTPDEFAQGHVPTATLIPHDELAARLAELDRDRPVLVYCRSGRRATDAEKVLAANGFDVRQIEGSWLRWQEESLPVEGVPAAAEGPAAENGGDDE